MKYAVTVLFDACRSATIEAESPEEAEQKAHEEVGHASLCHHCAGEIDVGDALGAHVYEDEGNGPQVLDTTYNGERIAALKAEGDTFRALIEFLLVAEEPIAFLRAWNEGDFETCRREWPEAPQAVYPVQKGGSV